MCNHKYKFSGSYFAHLCNQYAIKIQLYYTNIVKLVLGIKIIGIHKRRVVWDDERSIVLTNMMEDEQMLCKRLVLQLTVCK